MIGLLLAALAIVAFVGALVTYALLRGVSVRGSLDVRPGDAPPPEPRTPRARTQTQAAPAAHPRRTADLAQSYATPHPPPDGAHPHALGTWGTTTPETGVTAPPRRTGDS